MLSSAEADVVVDHRLFGIGDGASDENPPRAPHRIGHPWLSAGISMVYFEAHEDIIKARVRFESWDGPPPLDEATWPESETVVLSLPSGALGVDQITAGSTSDVFTVGGPGRYRARLAWREGELDLVGSGEPEAFALAQFWPAETG
jgi:hypothetical protein